MRAGLATAKKVQEATAYTLKKRDSLGAVMKRYGLDYKDVLLVNAADIKPKPGMVVYIPRFCAGAGTEKVELAQAGKSQERETSSDNELRPVRSAEKPGIALNAEAAAVNDAAGKTEHLSIVPGRPIAGLVTHVKTDKMKSRPGSQKASVQMASYAGGKEKPAQPATYQSAKKHDTRKVVKRSVAGRSKVMKHAGKPKASAGNRLRANKERIKPSAPG
jgi:hypothetical protein